MTKQAVRIFTIGFTKKSAEEFFTKLQAAGVQRVVDVRLNNTSQLAGFAKQDDLVFFLREIAGIEYIHVPDFAPTQDILDEFKKNKGPWVAFQAAFLDLMDKRRVDEVIGRDVVHRGCLLCSEHEPEHCHRRLVAEHLRRKWGNVEIVHLI